MLIAVLLFAESTVSKLGARRISPEEVRQVNDGDRIVIRNPRPRVDGSVLMIGPTHGGRVLTIVLNPEPLDLGAWDVRTAWEASPAQIARYRRDSEVGQNMVMPHDEEITSEELDELLDDAPTLSVKRPTEGTEVRLYVAVDAETLHDLQERAVAEGRDLSVVAAAALRNGARAA